MQKFPILFLYYLNLFHCRQVDNSNYLPNQVHLSIGEQNTHDIVVVWVTYNVTNESYVEYKSPKELFKIKEGVSVPYEFNQRTEYIHKVILTELVPDTVYTYHCGGPTYGWSNVFQFKSFPKDEEWGPRLLLFGDLGVGNARSLTRIQEEIFQHNFVDLSNNNGTVNKRSVFSSKRTKASGKSGSGTGRVDAILHVGDFAYDMNDKDGRVGDDFLNEIEPVAANVPYLTCPGNHENNQNFSQYRNKFSMPNARDMMFSFNMGPVHFISFSTEYYYFIKYGLWQIKNQYEWLEQDLLEATSPENRVKRPWIITFGHRPMYCSNKNVDDCTKFSSRVRTGIPFFRIYGLEELFYRYNVDVELWAHEHDYERSWPLYNYQVLNGTVSDDPYHEPRAPVHIITGSAGCSEEHDPFTVDAPPWTAFRSLDYGYTRMHVHNKTHIYLEQVSDDQNGKVIDNVWIVKEKRLPYPK